MLKIEDVLNQAIEYRTSGLYEDYLKIFGVLVNHLDSEAVIKEVLLGDFFLEAIGHPEKTLRYRNPPHHPFSVLAEYLFLVLRTTDKEFEKEFSKFIEVYGSKSVMMACIKFLNGGKNDLALADFDLKTIRALGNFDTEPAYRTLDQVMRVNDKKVPYTGPRSSKHVIAAMKTLVKMGTKRALQSLLQLQRYARYAKPENSIKILMFELKPSDVEIEDLSTPTYNFDEQFKRVEEIGDLTVIMQILPGYKMDRQIADINGNLYKDFPKTGLEEYKDEVKELKGLEKIVIQDLRFYRDRIENTYRTGQNWKYNDWVRSHIMHPLVGYSARNLIWEFTSKDGQRTTGIWFDNKLGGQDETPQAILQDASGNALPEMNEDWTVKLWHPVEAAPEERDAWKDRVIALRVIQPFKQAFRETYTVTPPEIQTRTHSNRFAAHILFGQQFVQIAKSRNWDLPNYYSDNIYDPSTYILGHGVAFHIDFPQGFRTTASTGNTGSVVFDRGADLTTIPPIVFSEAMRDVDLFVSTCSIGVDPTWTPDREDYSYWTQYTTQELSDSAVLRKEVLQRILPSLIISQKCSIEGRWLWVKGELSTYKIHIGSGSVHLEPSNKHICIVPKPANKPEADSVYLPFESDSMLSLILSKAFLLANDTGIKDRSIMAQIKSSI